MNEGGKRRSKLGTIAALLVLALLSATAGYALRRGSAENTNTAATARAKAPTGSQAIGAPHTEEPDSHPIANTLAELGGAPSIDEILTNRGLARYEKLARFLATATSADCEPIYTELTAEEGYFPHTSDMIFLRWAEVDPIGAAEKNQHATAWAWAKHDPDAAFAHMLEHGNAGEALRGIAQSDPQRALELLRQHPEAGDHGALEGIATGLARTDPRAGIEFALAKNYERFSDLDDLVKNWTHHDPDAAIEFATSLPDLRQRWHVLEDVLHKLEQNDPKRALEAASNLPPGQMRDEFYRRQLVALASSNLGAAIEMGREISRPAERANALHAIAAKVVPTDPDTAIDLLAGTNSLTHISPPGALLQSIAEQRPSQALEAGIAPTTIADLWVRDDPETASAWIGGRSEDPSYPQMVRGLINGITHHSDDPDFASAAAWAASIPGDSGSHQIQAVYEVWMRVDHEAASSALQTTDAVPEHIRQLLLLTPRHQFQR